MTFASSSRRQTLFAGSGYVSRASLRLLLLSVSKVGKRVQNEDGSDDGPDIGESLVKQQSREKY